MDRRGGEASADAELLGRSVDGDVGAFSILVGRHERAVHAFLARRAGRAAAEDLLAEVWLAAWKKRHAYDTAWPNAAPWLFGIARNVLRAHYRAARQPESTVPVVLDTWSDVDARLDGAAAVRSAVAGLPIDERDVLLLVVWEQLTPSEVAVALGIPAGTARSRLHRARQAIRARDQPATAPTCATIQEDRQ